MADNAISDDRVLNRARIVEIDGTPETWMWLEYRGVTIEQAAKLFAMDSFPYFYGCSNAVVEVERDGISHRIGVERVVTYRTTGLRGGD